jgi:armadillo repeat-containing protein 8
MGCLAKVTSHIFATEQVMLTLFRFLVHENPEFQEEAFHLVRNLAGDEAGIDMVFEGLGATMLLNAISQGIDSENDGVLRQVRFSFCFLPSISSHGITGDIRPRQSRE